MRRVLNMTDASSVSSSRRSRLIIAALVLLGLGGEGCARTAASIVNSWASPMELKPHQFTVPTRTLIAVMVTTFAWQLEAFVIVLRVLRDRPLPLVPHLALLTMAVALNVACVRWAKAEVRSAPRNLRNLVLKPGQPVIVVAMVIGFGATLGLTTMFLMRP
jgi:hypothetical protein